VLTGKRCDSDGSSGPLLVIGVFLYHYYTLRGSLGPEPPGFERRKLKVVKYFLNSLSCLAFPSSLMCSPGRLGGLEYLEHVVYSYHYPIQRTTIEAALRRPLILVRQRAWEPRPGPTIAALGNIGYVSELISRPTRTRIKNFDTSVNGTIVSSETLFLVRPAELRQRYPVVAAGQEPLSRS
jgi:hypothetical protein